MSDQLTIVGGGIGGLTAAVAAAEAGWRVRLHEAHTQLGGRARTAAAPFLANWGPHVVYGDGLLWRWLEERGLTTGARGAPRSARLVLRIDGEGRRVPPAGLVRALLQLRRADAPVDRSFRDWAGERVGEAHAARVAAFMGVATFDHDPGRLSAAFVQERLVRATAFPPTVRYFPRGWATIIARLARRARDLGVTIETGAPVDALPPGPTILAVPMRVASTLLGRVVDGEWEGTTTALLDVGLHRRRDDPYVLSDLDAPGFCETFTRPDPSLAPAGMHLVQTQAGMRPAETLEAAVARIEALLDAGYRDWRGRETRRRRARVRDESGALDLPGRTWRDRPSVHQGDDVAIVNDCVAAPGLLSEVSHAAALHAVAGLGAAGRPRATRVARLA